MGEDGMAIGIGFEISGDEGKHWAPSVAFNSSKSEYLVVWIARRNNVDYDIYGRILNQDGSSITETPCEIINSDATGNQSFPKVVYNNLTNQYVVV